jgi:hypothetical protein
MIKSGYTLAYIRDYGGDETQNVVRGETIQSVWPTAHQDTFTEFTYVWDGNRWFVGTPEGGVQSLVELGAVLRGDVPVRSDVKVPFLGTVGRYNPLDPSNGGQHLWSWFHPEGGVVS